jgi:putative transposase
VDLIRFNIKAKIGHHGFYYSRLLNMMLSHRIELDPTNAQATHLAQAAGVARFAYNWALGLWHDIYQLHKLDPDVAPTSEAELRRALNALKREHYPWMMKVTKCAPQMAIKNLGKAFDNFFAGRSGYPRFKTKGRDDCFTLSNDQFRVDGSRIHIPKLKWVRMREPLRFSGKIISATISRVADRWFVSITVDTPTNSHLRPAENQGAVGVDLGVAALATLSTGEVIVGPKPHKALLARLKRLSRRLSRKQKGSANRQKAKIKLAQLHARIAAIRLDALHQLTSDLTRRFHTIAIEDLNVRGMMKNRRLARAIADMSFFEFRRQLEYKAAMRGGQVWVADRFYPSSKTCSCCGHKLEKLELSVRAWACPSCSTHHDRDVNAAINLKNMAERHGTNEPLAQTIAKANAVSSTVSACGEEGSGSALRSGTKPASTKQEENSRFGQS